MTLVFLHDYIKYMFFIELFLGSIGLIWLFFIYKNSYKKENNTNKENQNTRINDTLNIGDIREISNQAHHIQDIKQAKNETKNGQTNSENLPKSSHSGDIIKRLSTKCKQNRIDS